MDISNRLRAAVGAGALLVLGLAACGAGGASSPGPPGPAAATVVPTAVQKGPIAIVGDSIAVGYTAYAQPPVYTEDATQAWPAFAGQLVGRQIVNLAVPGTNETQQRAQVPQIPANVTTVVYEGGTGDVAHDLTDTPTLIAHIDDIVGLIHAQVPKAQIVFMDVRLFSNIPNDGNTSQYGQLDSVFWSQLDAWNDHEKSFGYPLLDIGHDWFFDPTLYPDGIHPSPAQVQTLAGLMAPLLR